MVHLVTGSVNIPEKYAVAPGPRKGHILGGDSMPTTFDAPGCPKCRGSPKNRGPDARAGACPGIRPPIFGRTHC